MFSKKKILETLADGILTLNKRVNLLEKADNYNTMYEEQANKRIETLEKYDNHHTQRANEQGFLIGKVEDEINEIKENIRLIMEYLVVHKEVVNDTFLVEDDCICDECLTDEEDDEEYYYQLTDKGREIVNGLKNNKQKTNKK